MSRREIPDEVGSLLLVERLAERIAGAARCGDWADVHIRARALKVEADTVARFALLAAYHDQKKSPAASVEGGVYDKPDAESSGVEGRHRCQPGVVPGGPGSTCAGEVTP